MVKAEMIRLAKPQISEEAIKKVSEILRSGDLVQGRYVQQFEYDLQKYLNIEHAIVVSSGTAALHLSLLALGIGPGDEVIVPAFSFPATANVVEAVGAKVIFVDINLDDFCIDTNLIEASITPRTKAIIPVHEFGMPADMEPIIALANHYNLKIIEDAACALGSTYASNKIGSLGDMGCFSFHPRKTITTGEGGFIATNNEEYANCLRSLRNHGIDASSSEIDFVRYGYNYRMTDFQAVMGITQLVNLDGQVTNRLRFASIYDERLKGVQGITTPPKLAFRKSVYQTYHILLNGNVDRIKLIQTLKSKDIESNIGAYAIPAQSYYRDKYSVRTSRYENASYAYTKGLALPIGEHLSDSDVEYIVSVISESEFNC